MNAVLTQTVADWARAGYRGLRIMRCPDCDLPTCWSWDELAATPDEDVVAVARRVRCAGCGQPPAGLAVVACRDVEAKRSHRVRWNTLSAADRTNLTRGEQICADADT